MLVNLTPVFFSEVVQHYNFSNYKESHTLSKKQTIKKNTQRIRNSRFAFCHCKTFRSGSDALFKFSELIISCISFSVVSILSRTVHFLVVLRGWSGDAMVLGKLPETGRPTILIAVGQEPIALAVGASGGGLDIFTLIYPFSSLSPSLWETARYRLRYCLKGPLNPKQPTNQLFVL